MDETYESYWALVFGAGRTAEDVVREFGLVPSDRLGLAGWLDRAEREAWAHGGNGGEMPTSWRSYHNQAMHDLADVIAVGDWVVAVDDYGVITSLDGTLATVGWSNGTSTEVDVEDSAVEVFGNKSDAQERYEQCQVSLKRMKRFATTKI